MTNIVGPVTMLTKLMLNNIPDVVAGVCLYRNWNAVPTFFHFGKNIPALSDMDTQTFTAMFEKKAQKYNRAEQHWRASSRTYSFNFITTGSFLALAAVSLSMMTNPLMLPMGLLLTMLFLSIAAFCGSDLSHSFVVEQDSRKKYHEAEKEYCDYEEEAEARGLLP